MSLRTVTAAAVATFPFANVSTPAGTLPLPDVMVGISGAEDGFGNAPGDPLSIYPDGGAAEAAWSCGGMTSFGAWQINLPANHALVAGLSGLTDPCAMASWLADDGNCARAALAVYRSQGLGAWTTYRTGAWQAYLGQAQQAVDAALAAGGAGSATPPAGTTPTNFPVAPQPTSGALVGLALLAAGGTALALGLRHGVG